MKRHSNLLLIIVQCDDDGDDIIVDDIDVKKANTKLFDVLPTHNVARNGNRLCRRILADIIVLSF